MSEEIYFQCVLCKRRFKTKRGLDSHSLAHSTKGQRLPAECSYNFLCPLCPKSFKTKRGLDNHKRTCSKVDATALQAEVVPNSSLLQDSSPNVNAEVDVVDTEEDMFPDEPLLHNVPISEENMSSYIECEEEMVEARGTSAEMSSANVNVKQNKKSKKALVTCRPCKKAYFSLDGYANHLISHSFTEMLTLKGPPLSTVLETSQQLLQESLTEIISCPTNAGKGPEIVVAAEELLKMEESESVPFANVIFTKLYNAGMCTDKNHLLLPSDLRTSFTRATANYIGNITDRKVLSDLLGKVLPEKESLLSLLIPCLIRQMSKRLVVFIVRHLLGEVDNLENLRVFTNENTSSVDFKQNMHYVGGSNVCSVLRTARRYKNGNEEWTNVIKILKDNFIASEMTEPPPPEFTEWTELQSNGGLIKLSGNAGDFFIALGQLVKPLERLDGSVLNEEVFEKVCASPRLVVLWDDLVKDFLPKAQSFKLLHAICYHFCVTWRSGIISRRIDAIQKEKRDCQQGKNGIAFRATL